MKRLWLTLLICCVELMTFEGSAQDRPTPDGSACLGMARSAYAAFGRSSTADGVYMRYSVESVQPGVRGKRRTVKSVLAMRGGRMQMLSDDVELYQDESASISVMPAKRRIVIADPAPDPTVSGMQFMDALRDTILTLCDIRACEAVQLDDGSAGLRMRLNVPESLRRRFGGRVPLERIAITVRESDTTIAEFMLDYIEGYPLAVTTVTIEMVDFSADLERLSTSAYDYVFTPGHRLRERFKDFTVNDLRTRNK